MWPVLPAKQNSKKRIWIQAVSVGELSSIHFLLEELFKEPNIEIVLTGTTSTGQKIAIEKYSKYVLGIGPFPLDWLPFSYLAWSKIKPDIAICVDSELWPEHMEQARRRCVPIYILNGRLSDRSFNRLGSLTLFQSLILPEHLFVIASSEKQKERWIKVGIKPEKCSSFGNLKVDITPIIKPSEAEKFEKKKELGFSESSIVLVGISTWPGEEEFLLESVHKIRDQNIDLRLLLIPRHAERGKEVIEIIESYTLPFKQRTKSFNSKQECIVYLADTTGELTDLIKSADIAFLGKTLPPRHEGQNPIEPIATGLPLIIGPSCTNFPETSEELININAAIKGDSLKEIEKIILKLTKEKSLREKMRKAGLNWRKIQGSPSIRILSEIKNIISKTKSD